MDIVKPGDRVRLKKVTMSWVVPEETWMTVLDLEPTEAGEPGAKCKWRHRGNGHAFENVFPLVALTDAS